MKYTTEITIDLPRERVVELFDDADNLAKWQPGLRSFEHISGEPGQPGAQSRLVYDMNGRTVEMVETITQRDLPETFAATYETKGVKNWVTLHFHEAGPNQTRWVEEDEFKFSGMMRVIGLLFRRSFPKQTQQNMQQFKEFAENA